VSDPSQDVPLLDVTNDELIDELDRRLAVQGFDTGVAGVRVVVEYLREGWTLIALPADLVEGFDSSIADGRTVHVLANELRRRLAETEPDVR
jgi:hypothetical protein